MTIKFLTRTLSYYYITQCTKYSVSVVIVKNVNLCFRLILTFHTKKHKTERRIFDVPLSSVAKHDSCPKIKIRT